MNTSRLFRRLFLERLQAAFDARMLGFYTNLTHLADRDAFAAHVQAMRRIDWVVYAKKPFGGPAQVLAYLGRYTHRVAIANRRMKALDDDHVAFTWKDYRQNGAEKIMRLKPDEFIRRFLLHTLPDGFHRIRYFGFMTNGHRAAKIASCRALLVDEGLKPENTPSASVPIAAEPAHHRAHFFCISATPRSHGAISMRHVMRLAASIRQATPNDAIRQRVKIQSP
jgi:Putative transposase